MKLSNKAMLFIYKFLETFDIWWLMQDNLFTSNVIQLSSEDAASYKEALESLKVSTN